MISLRFDSLELLLEGHLELSYGDVLEALVGRFVWDYLPNSHADAAFFPDLGCQLNVTIGSDVPKSHELTRAFLWGVVACWPTVWRRWDATVGASAWRRLTTYPSGASSLKWTRWLQPLAGTVTDFVKRGFTDCSSVIDNAVNECADLNPMLARVVVSKTSYLPNVANLVVRDFLNVLGIDQAIPCNL
jgi:hypothetical protein